MKLKAKLIVIVVSFAFSLLVLPNIVIRYTSNEMSLGFSFVLFFIIYPMLEIFLGIISGTDMKRLFFVPFVIAFLFPFCFGIAIKAIIWELFIYSILYSVCGTLIMLATHFFIKYKKEKRGT